MQNTIQPRAPQSTLHNTALAPQNTRLAPQPQTDQTLQRGPIPRDLDQDRGIEALLRDSQGEATLPPPIELVAALEAAARYASLADRAVPGLGKLIAAVLADEQHKLTRTLDLSGR